MSTALQYNLVKNELLVGNDFYVNMNNTKPMISEAAVDFPSPTRATKRKRHKLSRQQQPMPIGSEIRNLPANLVVTPEILKNNVCRVCATYYESGLDLVSLYTGHQGEGPRLAIIMNTMLPIKVRKQDGLSQYACRTCVNQLMAWRKLREGVVEAQKILINQTTQLIRDLNYGMNDRSAESPAPSAEGQGFPDEAHDDESDSAPLADLVSADPLAALRRALRDLRDHYRERHLRARRSPSTSGEERRPEKGEVGPDGFDDLTHRNKRRDRFDPATRAALDAARGRGEGGRLHYTCPVCSRRLASPHAFLQHARIHSGERAHICHACGAAFRARGGLQRHVRETHERRRRRACDLCARTFANEQNLRQHIRTHTGERPHQCPECGKRFAQSGSLHAHRRTHASRRAFSCAECGAAFRLRAGLARHALRHSGERPHRCACGRAFAARHELAEHLPLHGDIASHACVICGAAYKLRRALRDHSRRAHPPPPPDLTRASAFPGTTIRTLHFVDLMDSSDDEETASPAAPLPPLPPPPPRPSADSAGYETRFRHYVWTD